jgi:hypothetical protein
MRSGEVADEAPVKGGLGEPVAELLRPGKAGSVRHEVAHGSRSSPVYPVTMPERHQHG